MPQSKLSHLYKSKLSQILGFVFLSTTAIANEQPSADSLVGESYVGAHEFQRYRFALN